jgi:hypothetical protein
MTGSGGAFLVEIVPAWYGTSIAQVKGTCLRLPKIDEVSVLHGKLRGEIMELNVGLIEGLAVFGVVWWLVYKALAPPSRPISKEQEKMCEPWWKSYHL